MIGENQMSLTQAYKAWKGDQAKAHTMEMVAVIMRPDGGVETLATGLFSVSNQLQNGKWYIVSHRGKDFCTPIK